MTEQSPLTYPTEFPIKVMGKDTQDVHASVAEIFARHVAPLDELNVSRQPSREGRFVSVTVIFTAESRAQLDALYTELSDNKHVLMTL